MRALYFALLRDNSGATAIEYGLIAILVSVAALGAISAIGSWVNSAFTTVGNDL
jgi:pilus assembly protein Flp/PilA